MDQVQTDGCGNILASPFARGLPCFAVPEEYFAGIFDKPYLHGDEEHPFGCSGCRVQPACAKVADERIQNEARLRALYEAWDARVLRDRLTGSARLNSPEWHALVAACATIKWSDCNDGAIAADNAKRAKAAKENRRAKRVAAKAARRGRKLTFPVVEAIRAARDLLETVLIDIHAQPGAPRYISKLNAAGIKFTADVWEGEQLHVAAGLPVKGVEIARRIVGGNPSASDERRVSDARRRLTRLYDAGVCGDFENWPAPNSSHGRSAIDTNTP